MPNFPAESAGGPTARSARDRPRASTRKRLLWVLLALASGPFLAEFGLRWLLFSSHPLAVQWGGVLRDPAYFVPPNLLPDYWRIDRRIGLSMGVNEHPRFDERIGWRGPHLDAETLQPTEFLPLEGRRPVLLFGASFVACREGHVCWETIFEDQSELAEDYVLINCGVWGHGADQTWILLEEIIERWQPLDPVVVLGFVAESDLFRPALPIYIWPKPRFIEGSSGELVRVDPPGWTAKEFLAKDPVSFRSYGWRAIEVNLAGLSRSELEERYGRDVLAKTGVQLSKRILRRLHLGLEQRGLEHFTVFFHSRLNFHRKAKCTQFFASASGMLGSQHSPLVSLVPELAPAFGQADTYLPQWFIDSGPGQGHPTEAARRAWLPALERGLRREYDG